jgi:hypothetical protein
LHGSDALFPSAHDELMRLAQAGERSPTQSQGTLFQGVGIVSFYQGQVSLDVSLIQGHIGRMAFTNHERVGKLPPEPDLTDT